MIVARRGLVERAEGRDARETLAEAERLGAQSHPSQEQRVIDDLRRALSS